MHLIKYHNISHSAYTTTTIPPYYSPFTENELVSENPGYTPPNTRYEADVFPQNPDDLLNSKFFK